jgi:hypothetical protein
MRRWWRMHPRAGLAIRTAIAGGLAWFAAQLLPSDEAGRYAYFAPMGAVVVTSTSLAGTIRDLLRSLGALTMGAILGLAAMAVMRPTAWGVAIVILVSVAVSGWRRISPMGSWVPTVAIFTLVLGQGQPFTYASAYAGLTALGAAIGVATVVVMPQLVVEPLDAATRRLLLTISERLQQIRDDLRSASTIGLVGRSELDTAAQRVADQLTEADDGSKLNRRSVKLQVQPRVARAEAIRTMAHRVSAFEQHLVEYQSEERPDSDPDFGDRIADAVDLILQVLQRTGDDLEDDLQQALSRVDEVVQRLTYGVPGRHTASASVYELHQLTLAVREVVKYEDIWDDRR